MRDGPTRTAKVRVHVREATWAVIERNPDPPTALGMLATRDLFQRGLAPDEVDMVLADPGFAKSCQDAWVQAGRRRNGFRGTWPTTVKLEYPVPGTRKR